MTMTIADRRAVPEATGLPDQLAFKTAEAPEAAAGQMVAIDETQGIVTAVVSVTGVVDEVDDVIVPGAYAETLAKRRPKVCWAHSWEHPIGKVLYIEELLPGDERLPKTTRDGQPWPKAAGALVASMQFNLRTDEGKNAFEVVRFYSESGECEYSIGYNVPPGRAATDSKGTRFIKMLELYELSVVLFGAHTMTGTLSIKDAARAMEVKRVIAPRTKGGVDFGAMMQVKRVLNPPVVTVRAGTGEVKVGDESAPPPFQKREDAEPGEVEKSECTCCGGSGEHTCGHECYVCDAAGTLEAQSEGDSGVPEGEPLVCQGHHGRSAAGEENPPEGGHDPDPVSPDSAPEGTPVAAAAPAEDDDDPEAPEATEEAAEGEGGAPGEDTRPPGTEQVNTSGEEGDDPEKPDDVPDFSDGIMVAVYPDPAAADAVAAHIAGPDDTTPREELHVTLAYLGKIGGSAPTEQEVIDSVTRAVEGQPALEGEIGGIGQFPAGEDGAPTYAPVDVPGLGLLREQIVSELGDVVFNDHGFTPHMTLGYNIGIIDPVPPTPVKFTEVRVVYGNSQRAITLGAPVPESKTRMFFTEVDPPAAVEAKAGDLWFRTSDATMHECDGGDTIEWKAVDPMTAPVATVTDQQEQPPTTEAKAAAYDPSLDVKSGEPRILPGLSKALEAAMEGKAEGGADRNRGGAEELRRYWTTGEGGVKIGWGTPGDFSRCVVLLEEHMPGRAEGYCANRHKEMNGFWPGDDKNKDAGAMTETKISEVPVGGKSYPQMPGSYEERQQAIREALYAQYADDVDEHGHPNVWIDLRSTWTDRVLYSVDRYNVVGDNTEHFLAAYRIEEDGMVEFGERNEVELSIVPVLVESAEEGDEVPLGDALPLVEDVMGIVTAFKTAQRAMEGKAGRVLSGANERNLRTAVEHLLNVLAAAGIDLGEVTPDKPRPTGNSGSDADQRIEIDPAVDLETTSPVATTKDAGADTETKGLASGEVLTIDMDAHRALLASIEEMTAED